MVSYDQQLRGRATPMMAVVAMLLGFSGFVLLLAAGAPLFTAVAWLLSGAGRPWSEFRHAAQAFEIPQGLWVAHVTLALLIVIVLALFRWVLRSDAAHACSVQPGIRWRYLVVVTLAVLPVMAAAVWFVMSGRGAATPQPGYWAFLVAILATSGLQAAGEEFFFRGLLLTGLGAMMRTPGAVVGSALVFALLHGTQSVPLFLDRFAFGVIAGVLVVLTGGLEAAIAIHAVNNVLAFAGAGLWGTIAATRATTSVSWLQAGIDVALFATVAALAWGIGRRMGVATFVRSSDLLRTPTVR